MIKGAIFDADGTLLDSMVFWHTLIGESMTELGVKFDNKKAADVESMSPAQCCGYIIREYNLNITVEEMMAMITDRVIDFYAHKVTLKPGIAEFLEKLKEKGVAMTVATGTDTPLVTAGLKRCGILSCFKEVLCCEDVGKRKTEPDVYRVALEHIGTKKEETLVFEDALYCVDTAKKDGFTVVGVYDGEEKNQDGMKEACDFLLKDYDDFDGMWKHFS